MHCSLSDFLSFRLNAFTLFQNPKKKEKVPNEFRDSKHEKKFSVSFFLSFFLFCDKIQWYFPHSTTQHKTILTKDFCFFLFLARLPLNNRTSKALFCLRKKQAKKVKIMFETERRRKNLFKLRLEKVFSLFFGSERNFCRIVSVFLNIS